MTVCVPKGVSLMSGNVGPLTLRTPKLSSLIRPERSSVISIKPSELRRQRWRANIFLLLLFLLLCVRKEIVLSHLISTTTHWKSAGEEMSKLKFSCLLMRLFIYLFIYLCACVSLCVCVPSSQQYIKSSCKKSLYKGFGCVWVRLIVHMCWRPCN